MGGVITSPAGDQFGVFGRPLEPLMVSAMAMSPNQRMNGSYSPVTPAAPAPATAGGGGPSAGCAAAAAPPSATERVGPKAESISQALGACGLATGETGAAGTGAAEAVVEPSMSPKAARLATNFETERILQFSERSEPNLFMLGNRHSIDLTRISFVGYPSKVIDK